MLAHRRTHRPPAFVADASSLPMADDAVGAAVAAFVLSHVDDPAALLGEARRVTTPGGSVVAVSFAATGARSPVHGVVEEILRRRGWVAPTWFRRMKEELEPAVAEPDRMVALAAASGLDAPMVTIRTVDTGVDSPDELVAWRLGSPGVAPFVAALAAEERNALHAEAVAALGPRRQPLVLDLLVLSALAATARRSAEP
jgi:SAM-dependent methyltransferase